MITKESFTFLQEKIDAAVTRVTRNQVNEFELGRLRITIYERRRGSWLMIRTPHAEQPLRGKKHDIIYSYDPISQETERTTLGKLAKNPEGSMITKNPKKQDLVEKIYYPTERDEEPAA